MRALYCEGCRRSTAGTCAKHFHVSDTFALPPTRMTGPHKCPDCGTWWVGFEHRCRPAAGTTATNAAPSQKDWPR